VRLLCDEMLAAGYPMCVDWRFVEGRVGPPRTADHRWLGGYHGDSRIRGGPALRTALGTALAPGLSTGYASRTQVLAVS
jgi:hypothetical protein